MRRGSLAGVCVLLVALSAAAAEEETGFRPSIPGAVYAPEIPSPEQATGVAPGSRPLRPEEILRFFESLAASSPRAKVVEYARSHEGRPLVILAIGDEPTIARLDAFREEHARLADPRGRAEADDGRLVEGAKAVAWMAYGIHGDELSSSDAAVALAYWLVAGEDERARTLRRELLVLIDPDENPDGRARSLSMAAAFAHAAPNPDEQDLSHSGVWPWGRGNHYLFDINRDWITMVHPESRRSSVIASWLPQLVVDSHEMGADDTYLFPPSRHPFNPWKPARLGEWAKRFAADQARALDGRGWAYYTGEWNEEFFPGYGSSWASYHGAVGILYEMGGVEGTLVRQRAGTLRTYPETVDHQLTSSVANLETLAKSRREILRDFVASRREAVRRGAEGPVRAYVLPPGRDPERTGRLAALLRDQGIEVLRAAAPVRAQGLRDVRTGESKAIELPEGAFLVPLDQPAGALARVLLDPHVPMEAKFLREEREWLERGKGTRLYDTTSWSLPLLYGVEAYWTGAKPAGDWRSEPAPGPEGSLERAQQTYGWVFDGTADRSVGALAEILQEGIAARVAEKPFRVEGRSFAQGAVLVKREGNPPDTADRLEKIARRWKIEARAVSTAKAEEGPDLGGNYFHPLVSPRTAVLTGAGVSPDGYGHVWRLLDETTALRFTGVDVARFERTDLDRFNVLVFPPAWGGYGRRIGKNGIERIRRWIEAGGTAIGIGDGADFLADKDAGLTRTRLRRQALDRFPPVVLGPSAEVAAEGGPFRAAGERAPSRSDDKEKDGERRPAKEETVPAPASPYDVEPVLGPGARPFAEGLDLGTPVAWKPVDLASWLKPLLPPGKERPDAEDLERGDERLRRFSPRGAIVRAELDREVWLTWGMPAAADVWLDARDTFVAEPPVQVAVRFAPADRLHLAGLLWPEGAGRLARTAYATREEVGRGQVILFLGEPDFRGWTVGTRRLLQNAILYGPGLGTRWPSPW